MDGDESNETAGSQIAIGDKQGLDETGWRVNVDAILAEPNDTDEEADGLMDVGEQQVVNQDEKLIRSLIFDASDLTYVRLMGDLGRLAVSHKRPILEI